MNSERFLKPLKSNIIRSVDNIDPISLNVFWELKNEKKKVVYPKNEYKNLILYFDSMKLIRCFEKESLQYMKSYNVTKHPVTNEDLPSYLFDNIDMIDIEALRENDKIEDIAFSVFQYFSKISIFIDSEWFFKLEKDKLLRLNYEMKDFWLQNFSEEQRNDISNEAVFILSNDEIDKMELVSIQKYLLNQMKMILKCEKEEYRYMINYIILGALGLFITEIKELYPDFSFTF
jgi:hypothetical protein